jgi:hypothetical protein
VGKRDIACNQTNFGSKDSLLKKHGQFVQLKTLFFLEFVSAFVGFIPMATFPVFFQYSHSIEHLSENVMSGLSMRHRLMPMFTAETSKL